ncbi:MAG: hypothetical protein GC146_01980 [Limimaricola sp.]|uniref:hypothetical protein n=1 Tax=Limimaricola sp. TaxID=2211665 RepID=UPI001E10B7F4|nr:hypothetical protein [Limimaricola sp.]MBI1415966.1 hypothetical protein [Limimaricola sp.]
MTTKTSPAGFVACAFAAFMALLAAAPAQAEANAPAAASAAPQAQAATPLVIDGFRSAKFGMDEAAVRAAIIADFGVKDADINAGENAVERTKILTVSVPNLLPDGGTAQVSYVLGYTSKALIQIGATWSTKTDPAMTPKMLFDNGDVLRSHFRAEGYQPDSIKLNVALPTGVLMFRGSDSQGHATLLLLQGTYTDGADGAKTLTPTSLDLLYSANPDAPDIFKLQQGAF